MGRSRFLGKNPYQQPDSGLMNCPKDQEAVAQMVSDVLKLSTTSRTPKGEAEQARAFGAFADWVVAENRAGRVVDLSAIAANAGCKKAQDFCPIRGI